MTGLLPDPLLAFSFDWEGLIPVVFFIVYILSQVFGGKKKPGEALEELEEEDPEVAERARQIREEIRRKIEARRSGQESGEPVSPAPVASASASPRYDPRVPENQPSKPSPNPVFAPAAPMMREPARPQPASRPVVPPAAGPTVFDRLREQRERLAAAVISQEEARQKAAQIEERAGAYGKRQKRVRDVGLGKQVSTRAGILRGLRDPATIREAVLYREILDQPVGMRDR